MLLSWESTSDVAFVVHAVCWAVTYHDYSNNTADIPHILHKDASALRRCEKHGRVLEDSQTLYMWLTAHSTYALHFRVYVESDVSLVLTVSYTHPSPLLVVSLPDSD